MAGVQFSVGAGFSSSPPCPDWVCDPPILLSNWVPGALFLRVKWLKCETDHQASCLCPLHAILVWHLFTGSALSFCFLYIKYLNVDPFDLKDYFAFLQGWEGNKRCKQIRDQVIADAKYNPLQVFELLLNTAQFELKIRDMFKHVSYVLLC
jgi:hypothetical protein